MRCRLVTLTAIAGVLLTGCTTFRRPTPLNTALAGQTTFHAITVGGALRTFLLHLPPAAASRRVPLVFVLHGHKANAEVAMRTSRMNRVADSLGMAVLYPNGSGPIRGVGLSWNSGTCCGYALTHKVDDLAFIDSLHAVMARTGHIDTNAVFVAGFSSGGMLALRIACERATSVRAVANVAGAMPNATCMPAAPVAVLLMHGDEDDELRDDHRRHITQDAPPYARSYEAAAAFWERVNGCAAHVSGDTTRSPLTVVRTRLAVNCASARSVQVVSIPEHPHAWPGGQSSWWFGPKPSQLVDGSVLVLTFFAQQLLIDSTMLLR